MFSLSLNLGKPSAQMGSMYVRLDKGEYVPGEQVSGVINLNLFAVFNQGVIYLTAAGVEQVKLVEIIKTGAGTDAKEEKKWHNDRNFFFNNRFPVHHFQGGFLAAGQYSFPFSFVLPTGLPSSFSYKFTKDHEACFAMTSYEISATLGSAAGPALSFSLPLSVNQPQIFSNPSQRMEMNQEVTHCCCVAKGRAKITSYFEKNEYVPGETAFLITEADNMHSQAAINHIKGEFRQVVRLKAGAFEHSVSNSLCELKTPGIQPGEQRIGPNAIRLEVPLINKNPNQWDKNQSKNNVVQPTSRGKLINNEYYLVNTLEMDACICCGEHPNCKLQLNIRNPSLVYNPWAGQPEGWSPQVFNPVAFQVSPDTRFDVNMYVDNSASSPQYAGQAFPQMPGMPPPPN
jgi:hypothetical protein